MAAVVLPPYSRSAPPAGAGTAEIRKQKRGNPMSEYVVELKNITKRFPGVVALKNMSIGIRPGEIHG